LSVSKTIKLSIAKQNRGFFCKDEFIQVLLKKKNEDLSSGELCYLEIKIILFNSSKFVLLDESYNGLSPKMVDIVGEMIKVNSYKKGIVITDHNYQNVIKISTRLLLIKEGKVLNINDKAEFIEKGYLTNSAFL
jgi:ABC-type lipopolysaccharide export system ATPase subunit